MKYLRRQNLNLSNVLDDTVLQTASGNIELNPTQRVTIRGDLDIIGGAIPGPEVTNVMYVTLDGDDDNSGYGEGPNQSKRTLKSALASAQQGTTIYVRSGEYYEDNPLRVPPKVSIMGDNLRTTIIRPLNGPVSFDITDIERTDNLTTITVSAPHGLSTDDRIRVRCSNDSVDETDVNIYAVPAPDQITYRQAGSNISSSPATGVVKYAPELFLVNSANYLANMVFKGVAAPAYCVAIDSDAIVDTSPYVQNCSNINGPWMRNGVEWLPFQTEQPDLNGTMVTGPRPLRDDEIDPLQVDTFGIDIEGGGGGILVDGDRYNSQSPIKSMVGDAFTQVAQGGVGFHITNFGYMQIVSCFAVFCSKAFYTTRGGYLSLSNSVIDFGSEGFVADGYYLDPYTTAVTNQDYFSEIGSITVVTAGSGFSSPPSIFIDPPTTPGGVQATAIANIDPILGVINAITVTDPGSGYDFQPNVNIVPSNGATATANLAKNQFIEVYDLANKPQVGSVMLIGEIDPFTGYEIGYYVSQITDESFTFSYDEQKCRRDIGYILDAVLGDAVLGTNHATVFAGLSYLRSYSSKVTSLQKSQTIAGLQEARNLALTYTSDSNMQVAITNGFNTVNNIINLGISAAPSVSNTPTSPRRAGYYEAAEILLANKNFIQTEIEYWIAENYPALVYDVATCRRDVGYIIDALAYDLTYEGNYQTINAALSYAEGSVIAGEVEETQAAYEYWKTIVGSIVRNIAITPTTGNTVIQNTSLPVGIPVDPLGPSEEAEELIQIIIDVVDHGTGYVPDPRSEPEYANGDSILNVERLAILEEKRAIQDGAIDYLNNTYGGSAKIFTFPPIQNVASGTNIRFHNVSTISTGGTALEYVGAGVTYNALPFFGGQPIPANERIEINNGKCFTVSSDQVGNFRIGQFFTVNALTGEVSIDAENLNLSGLAAIGPFKRNGVPVGVQLREVSNNSNLIASTGFQDINTVPTQEAVANYVENRYLNKVNLGDSTVAGANITFTGDVGLNGGDLYSTALTFNLLNRDDKNSIGEDGPTTVNAFLNASTINIAHTTSTTNINGNLEVKGAIVSSSQATVDLLNTTTTTVNAFGAATDINIGANTGITTISNTTFELPNTTLVDIGGTNLTVQNSVLGGTLTLFDTFISTLNAFRSATAINMGESTGTFTINSANTVTDGDLQVKGGDITTNQTTFDLLNTTATTVNAFGAATTLNLGAGSGTTTIGNNLQVNLNSTLGVDTTSANVYWGTFTANIRDNTTNSLQIQEGSNSYLQMTTSNGNELTSFGSTAKVAFDNTTDASSTTVASTTFAGGVGIAKKLYVGTDLTVLGNSTIGDDRTVDIHAINGTVSIDVPDNTAVAFQIKENTQTYVTAVTTDGSESVTIESTPKLLVKNATDSTSKDTGALIVEGGVGIEKNLTVGVDLQVDRDITATGDLSVNGGDLSTTATTFNLLNVTATTINFAGAATTLEIGAATGTTNINNDLDVDGDVNIDGGDLTVSTATFNLANTNATTINLGGVTTAFNLGTNSAAATTFTLGANTNTGNTFKVASSTSGTVNYTTDVTSGTVNAWQTVSGTVNIGSSGTIQLGTSGLAATTVLIGGAVTGNILKISGTAAGTAILSSDVTSGTVDVFTDSTGIINIGGQGSTINIGNTNSNSILEVRGAAGGGVATITTNSGVASADLFNTVITTGNLFGSATTIEIGATTGNTNINNNLVVDGDLQVKGGDITTDQTTFNLLNATASTVNFAGAATTLEIGAATGTTNINNDLDVDGDLNLDGGDLTVSTVTFNLANTNATTINFAGAATTLEIGAATGTTNINNNLDVDGDLNIDGGDLTVSTTTFNLVNTTATTVNFAGAATAVNIGLADPLGLTTIKHDLKVDGDLNVDGTLGLGSDVTIAGDLAVNGGDLTTTATTFNLLNSNATTINFGGAATTVEIGAATGTTNINNDLDVDGDINFDGGDITSSAVTVNILAATSTTVNAFGAATALNLGATSGTTIVKNNLEVDLNTVLNGTLQVDLDTVLLGDLEVRGGDLTTNQTTFNLLNTVATTGNVLGVATAVNIATTAASASTLTFGGANSGNIVKIAGTSGGTINLTTDVTNGTANILTSLVGTTNIADSGTINLGSSSSATTSVDIGGAITGNQLKISGTAAGLITVTSDVTTGTVDLFNNVTTGTVNIGGAGASTINLGGTGSTVNVQTLTTTTDIEVQYGGTGVGTFTTNGVLYGNSTSALQVTAASNPGSNAITSYGILTTDGSNVPTWTDVIDGGSY